MKNKKEQSISTKLSFAFRDAAIKAICFGKGKKIAKKVLLSRIGTWKEKEQGLLFL